MKGIFLINSAFVSVSIIYPKSFQFEKNYMKYSVSVMCYTPYEKNPISDYLKRQWPVSLQEGLGHWHHRSDHDDDGGVQEAQNGGHTAPGNNTW